MMSPRPPGTAVVVGGGPGGLMVAEVLASAGVRVTVVEHKASVGRKFLLAGRSGLNLTNAEPIDEFLSRYGPQRDRLAPALRAFGPDDLRAWCEGLGEPTFVGSSGRVFPTSFRATPLLRAWLRRLDALGVTILTRTRWTGWAPRPDGAPDPRRPTVEHADGRSEVLHADVTVLALGGASWPRVGSDGGWVEVVRAAGVVVAPLRPANCGVELDWSDAFRSRFEGTPVKNVRVSVQAEDAGGSRGDLMVTATGLEGGPVYACSAAVRSAIDHDGAATVLLDLHPDLSVESLAARLDRRRPKDSLSSVLRRAAGLPAVQVALLHEVFDGPLPRASAELAALLKAVPVRVERTAGLERAISTAGGVAFDEVDEQFMLRRLPGVYVIGEMLDWEAPTGGYLLQATFSTAVAAARGALAQ
jgi:uncharacterized flavoprotein (TIGR03862 family)